MPQHQRQPKQARASRPEPAIWWVLMGIAMRSTFAKVGQWTSKVDSMTQGELADEAESTRSNTSEPTDESQRIHSGQS